MQASEKPAQERSFADQRRITDFDPKRSFVAVARPAEMGRFQSVRFMGKQFGSGRSKRRRADTRQVTAVLHNRYDSDEWPSFCPPARRAWTGGQMPSPMPAGG